MEEQETLNQQQEDRKNVRQIKAFLKKWGWLIAIGLAVIAFLFLFGPILSYKTRVYQGETKIDTFYDVNLISYFTSGFALNWTMYVTLGFLLLGIGSAVVSKWKKQFGVLSTLFFLLTLCFLMLAKAFFEAEENGVENLHGVSIAWGDALAIAFMTLASGVSLSQSYEEGEFTVRDIAEDGILIAMAFGLNFLKIPVGSTGGSINFQMLPLMLIALRRGPFHGFICGGLVYGLLTCLTDGYGFACFPFDYLIGFGSAGIVGFFCPFIFGKEQTNYNVKGLLFLALAGVLSTLVRYIGSNVSSIVVYGLDLKGALAYNAFYIPLSGLISFGAIMALYGPLATVNRLFPAKRNQIKK